MHHRRQSGDEAEALALSHLQRDGYRIIEQNYKGPGFELDAIALDAEVLCFIEVRSVHGAANYEPAETVTATKRSKIIKGAKHYLMHQWRGAWPEIRFDVVGIRMSEPPVIRVYQEAFLTSQSAFEIEGSG